MSWMLAATGPDTWLASAELADRCTCVTSPATTGCSARSRVEVSSSQSAHTRCTVGLDAEMDVDPGAVVRMTTSATRSASRSLASSGWLRENWPADVPPRNGPPGVLDLATTCAAK